MKITTTSSKTIWSAGVEEEENDNNETVAAFTGWGVSLLVTIILVLLGLVVVVGNLVMETPVKEATIDPHRL